MVYTYAKILVLYLLITVSFSFLEYEVKLYFFISTYSIEIGAYCYQIKPAGTLFYDLFILFILSSGLSFEPKESVCIM